MTTRSLLHLLCWLGTLAACAAPEPPPDPAERIADLERRVLENVADPKQANAAVDLLREVLAVTAAYQDKVTAARPEMFRMNADYDTDRAQFEQAYARMQQERRDLARKYVDLTFDLRATMTREEWGKVTAKMARAHGGR